MPAKPKHSDKATAKALTDARGMIGLAARTLGITRQALHARIKQSEFLQEALEDARETALDMAEHQLFEAADRGEPWAIKFFLSRVGKHRGYSLKVETVNTHPPAAADRPGEGEPEAGSHSGVV